MRRQVVASRGSFLVALQTVRPRSGLPSEAAVAPHVKTRTEAAGDYEFTGSLADWLCSDLMLELGLTLSRD
jgi:hypothetical protein